ncbi:hypothetical protein BGZ80_011208 [Entomortierella chlamydospora]|uniref:Uncharacterized protein n=1 Tax=Entomortierella chlamydospora TaxID=101097 RepID=A0A9P6MUG3_9FUNG|nr:hypothetical protein BGZ80_011208 [Entomortierella chlamydospora]
MDFQDRADDSGDLRLVFTLVGRSVVDFLVGVWRYTLIRSDRSGVGGNVYWRKYPPTLWRLTELNGDDDMAFRLGRGGDGCGGDGRRCRYSAADTGVNRAGPVFPEAPEVAVGILTCALSRLDDVDGLDGTLFGPRKSKEALAVRRLFGVEGHSGGDLEDDAPLLPFCTVEIGIVMEGVEVEKEKENEDREERAESWKSWDFVRCVELDLQE